MYPSRRCGSTRVHTFRAPADWSPALSARSQTARSGDRAYTLENVQGDFVMAICCGGTVTHSLIAPHPGLLAIAQTLKIDLGITIIAGIFVRLLQHVCVVFSRLSGGDLEFPRCVRSARNLRRARAAEKPVAFPAMSR